MVWITKSTGKIVKFNINKIRRTCRRAGASKQLADQIAKKVEQKVTGGMSTQEVLNITLHLLRRDMPTVAMRYDLKGSLLRLGPSGFSFEQLVASVLKSHGYKTKINSILKGGSGITHEIDVIASKSIKVPKGIDTPDMKNYVIECKYHASPGIYTGVKDVLYTYARFLDIQDASKKGLGPKFDQSWLATNTMFSKDVIKYAEAKGIRLLSWNYPRGNSLRELMVQNNLYPITALHTLDTNTQGKLATVGIVLINEMVKIDPTILSQKTGISIRIIKQLQTEAEKIIQ
ncbi:MAG: restriction endonuclease [Nanoarchaeota archaeon]|nr:restriction endonuclease [Nanoarchaeota archaeon]